MELIDYNVGNEILNSMWTIIGIVLVLYFISFSSSSMLPHASRTDGATMCLMNHCGCCMFDGWPVLIHKNDYIMVLVLKLCRHNVV